MVWSTKLGNGQYRQKIDEEYDGILPYHELFYLSAIANAAERSIEHLNRFSTLDIKNQTHDGACYEFFSAVLQAGHVSTCLWPNPRKPSGLKRAERLRKSFDPLFVERIKERKLRNRVTHLDEYLDEFCASGDVGEIIDGQIGDIELYREPHQRVLRLVDPIAKKAIVYGFEFSYSGYFESIASIGSRAREMFEKGGRLVNWPDNVI